MTTRGQLGTPYSAAGIGTVQVPSHHRHSSGTSSGNNNGGVGGLNNTAPSSGFLPSSSSTTDEMWVNVTWMPHSSLSQTSHVSLGVRSIHTIFEDRFTEKQQHQRRPEELRVTITVHGMAGLPLSISSTTPSLPLTARRKIQQPKEEKSKSNNNDITTNNHDHLVETNNFEEIQSPLSSSSSSGVIAPTVSKATHDCLVNHLLQIPIRWRDLPRDAYLLIEVYSSMDTKMYEATLALFDTYGKLQTGLQRVQLDVDASDNERLSDHTRKKKNNPGLHTPGRLSNHHSNSDTTTTTTNTSDSGGNDGNDNDPLWEASLILDQLQRFSTKIQPTRKESSSLQDPTLAIAAVPDTTTTTATNTATTASSSKVAGDPSTFGQVPSVPWLDAITKQHCQDLLIDAAKQEEQSDEILWSRMGNNENQESRPQQLPSFIILELPVFDVPIMHEETFYPISTQCASGSVTGLELSLYRQSQMKKKINKDKGKSVIEAEDDDTTLPLRLVPFLDHENENDNPVEDKYRTLAHDLLRGLVDPALKPDRTQRSRLAAIIASPSHHPTREEKDLLWRFRFSLVDNRRALTKFLLAVDWTVESEVVQAAELLEQWRKRSPIEVTDALKLLGKHVAFQTSLVRAYAIDTLAAAPDDELRLYLLQLVQALKYETSTTVDRLSQSANNNNNGTSPSAVVGVATSGGSGSVSSLATFLINRASKNIELANYLYWYLKVELQDPTHGARYNEVFSAFRDKLSEAVFTKNSSSEEQKNSSNDRSNAHLSSRSSGSGMGGSDERPKDYKGGSFMALADSVSKLGSSLRGSKESLSLDRSSPHKSHPAQVTTIWDVLVAQDSFISGIMDCQMQSRDARGKRDAKETHLRDSLSSKGFDRMEFAESVPLPSAPHILVKGVNPRTAKMFKSALYPALVEFRVDCASALAKASTSMSVSHSSSGSPTNTKKSSSSSTYKVIVKTGDDLRQDQLVIMMIKLMDGLLKRGTLDLCLKPYSIIATSPSAGLVEFVDGSIPISQILASYNNSIMQFFQSCAPAMEGGGAKYGIRPDVMQTYIRSCAGYCVITYILGVGDRHLDNIMLQPSGHFFHIDFGFIFGRDPKPLPPAFRLTREMVDGMGGLESTEYRQFCSLACQAFNTLRKSAGLVLNLLHLMSDAGIEDLSNNPSADSEGVISKVEERFRLELSDEQAETFFLGLINDSLAALAPRVMDVFHSLAVARR